MGDTTVATITTDDQGVASTALSAGTYTYTVESNDYAIKKTVHLQLQIQL